MLVPVIAPKAAFMFTVTMPACAVVDSTDTLLGMAVVRPCVVSAFVGPAEHGRDDGGQRRRRGHHALRRRSAALPALRKKTLTGTSDVGFGSVVVVVGRCGSRRLNGTFEGAMVLGEPCVGMAQPAATMAPIGEQQHQEAPRQRAASFLVSELVAVVHHGRVRTKRAPPLSEDSTRTSPCMTRMCSATSARPSPVPVPVPRFPEAEPR